MPQQMTIKLFETHFEIAITHAAGLIWHSPSLVYVEDGYDYSSSVHLTTNAMQIFSEEMSHVRFCLANRILRFSLPDCNPSDDVLRQFESEYMSNTQYWAACMDNVRNNRGITSDDVQITSSKWMEHTFDL